MSERKELIARLQAATGPDRELDLDIARALVPDVIVMRQRDDDSGADQYTHWHYTASLDAAIALVERVLPGWEWDVGSLHQDFRSNGEPRWIASVAGPITWVPPMPEEGGMDEPHYDTEEGRGATPAIALLIALLSAGDAK